MNKTPQPLDNVGDFQNFLREKALPGNFYEYFTPSKYFYNVLNKSKYYEYYHSRFNRQFRVRSIIPLPINLENNLNSAVSKIQIFNSSFNRNKILFQEFDREDTYYCEGDKYYFSSLLFQNPQKLEEFIVGKVLDILNIKIFHLLERFRITPK